MDSAPPNDFCDVQLLLNHDGSELPFQSELGKNAGFYFTTVFNKKPDYPMELGESLVEPYEMWQTVGLLTPRTRWPSRLINGEGIRFTVQHYPEDFHKFTNKKKASSPGSPKQRMVVLGGQVLSRREAGYIGHPDRPKHVPQDTRCAFGFVSLPAEAEIGDEFVLEVFLLPTAHQISACAQWSVLKYSCGEDSSPAMQARDFLHGVCVCPRGVWCRYNFGKSGNIGAIHLFDESGCCH
ncbi:MAG: hypothetical protein R3C20_01000 [Planctomycetaceae bacterium]